MAVNAHRVEISERVDLEVVESSQASEARRAAAALARGLELSEPTAGKLALITTEVATNLARHARGGRLLMRAVEERGRLGVELLALDRGPGIANLDDCLRDGYSTGGTLGGGLGAIRRLAALFDIHTTPGKGTALLARIWDQAPVAADASAFAVGTLRLPRTGESVCGDAWAAEFEPERALLLVADGLGHGPDAAAAADAAVGVFRAERRHGPLEIVQAIHAALRPTRGAAVAVAELDPRRGRVAFCGVGNVAGVMVAHGIQRGMASHDGTAGHEAARIQAFDYPWPDAGVVVLHSDGCSRHWNVAAYPGLEQRHPAVIAGVLYRDFGRARDDATVVVVRRAAAE